MTQNEKINILDNYVDSVIKDSCDEYNKLYYLAGRFEGLLLALNLTDRQLEIIKESRK